MRRMIGFDCQGDRLAGTLDEANGTTGLIIVSGGNEIRSGAYGGQASMAQHFAALGFPVFRYDRRGVGESEGINHGFESSAGDIAAAIAAFRTEAPLVERLVAFGNCDAATSLGLFHHALEIDALLLANPWSVETSCANPDVPIPPSAAAIRARYLSRLKSPRSLIDLVTGKIDLKKLAGGLAKAAQKDAPSSLAERLATALVASATPIHILISERDSTAMAFMAAWKSAFFAEAWDKVAVAGFDTASHSFADAASRQWLYAQLEEHLTNSIASGSEGGT